MLYDCGHEAPEPKDIPSVVTAGGWCAPSDTIYDLMKDQPTSCPDCKTRLQMMLLIGIDPGRNGENLKVARGGIHYPTPER